MSIVTQAENTRLFGRHKDALDLLSAGKVKEALTILVDLADEQPCNSYVCLDLGNVVLRMGMADQAVVAAQRAIELDSTSVEAFLLLAKAQENRGNLKDSIVALAHAVDMLRNPHLNEADLAKEELPPPLVFTDYTAIFMDFEIAGDVSNLTLKSTTKDKNKTFSIFIAISGDGPTKELKKHSVVESGKLLKERVLKSLPKTLATAVGIFPSTDFSYTLFKKTEVEKPEVEKTEKADGR